MKTSASVMFMVMIASASCFSSFRRQRRLQAPIATGAPLHFPGTVNWGFNNNWANNDLTVANAATMTQGDGASGFSITGDGVNAGGSATGGAASKADYKNANNSFSTGNAFTNTAAHGVNPSAIGSVYGISGDAFNNNWANNSQVTGAVESMALGKGATQISVGKTGVQANASGTQGTSNNGSWSSNVNSWSVGNAFKK